MDRVTETGPGTPPPEGAPKVVCYQCGQEGHYKRDCTLMDCTLGQRHAGGPDRRAASAAQVIKRLWVNGNPVEAILDSGCRQTIVRRDVIHPVRTRGAPVALWCVHGDIHYYPTTWVRIGDGELEGECVVAVGPKLAYPLLLGWDWPGLKRFLGQWNSGRNPRPEPEAGQGTLVAQGEQDGGGGAGHWPGLKQLLGRGDRGRNPGQEPEVGQGTLVAQGEQEGEEAIPGVAPAAEASGQTRLDVEEGDFLTQQREDPTLRAAWEQVRTTGETPGEDPPKQPDGPRFEVRDDRLYRVSPGELPGEERWQLLVPRPYRWKVLELAHEHPWAGHLGTEKTQQKVLQRFYWPGVYQEIKNFCSSCPQCQRTSGTQVPPAPLVPLPVVGTPFERVALNLVGPLEKSGRGHSYILVIVDYATRCPEAVPLKRATAPAIAEALVKLFSWVGLPRELLTDQGTNLTSKVMTELCKVLQIRKLRTSVYHPQTDGLVERFNRTLKWMLRKFSQDDPREWDKLLLALKFAVREFLLCI
nr:protein NYNRIN-like [Pelodiscus sinensis]|eukprot:XP_014426932.1 protein NYNRIN-like [Pelodiscus sinensis]